MGVRSPRLEFDNIHVQKRLADLYESSLVTARPILMRKFARKLSVPKQWLKQHL